jgi:hypothetical protein
VLLTAWAIFRRWNLVPWLVVGVFVLTTYPLMALIWHAEPMEIGRHALPVSVNFRFAGWLAVVFLLDNVVERFGIKRVVLPSE